MTFNAAHTAIKKGDVISLRHALDVVEAEGCETAAQVCVELPWAFTR
jgi:hypothetical protein